MANFEFLSADYPLLYSLANTAELYLYSDPNSCLIKLGQLAENVVAEIFKIEQIDEPFENTAANRIAVLKKEGLIPYKIDTMLYTLRTLRNKAVHEEYASVEKAKLLLEMGYKLCIWFIRSYRNHDFTPSQFTLPVDIQHPAEHERLSAERKIREQEAIITKLQTALEKTRRQNNEHRKKTVVKISHIDYSARAHQAEEAAKKTELTEAETRLIIDEQLRQVGWEADSIKIRQSKGIQPERSRNVAIAEWKTDSTVSKNGYADYALFCGWSMVGIIEAKKRNIDISSVIDYQCRDYAKNIRQVDTHYAIGT
ncbi:MAG: DUF4145 domain-containing protein [Treponema sp.]